MVHSLINLIKSWVIKYKWLSIGSKEISTVLKYADVTVISNTGCTRSYGPAIKPAKLCVATTGGSGPCTVSIAHGLKIHGG
jgi:hypothetical protein